MQQVIAKIRINENKQENEIKYSGSKGKFTYFILTSNIEIKLLDIKKIYCICDKCGTARSPKYRAALLIKPYICSKCLVLGNSNPFYGKKHTEETKKTISNKAIQRDISGEKNPFYGKTHSEETLNYLRKLNIQRYDPKTTKLNRRAMTEKEMEKSRETRRINWENLSEEEKILVSLKRSNAVKLSQIKEKQKNPEQYIKNKQKAARASCLSQERYFTLNKIEQSVQNILNLHFPNIFKYSVILNYYQFDFGSKEHRILIEVQGNYWHANPSMYKETELTLPQKKNLERDKKKKEWADQNNFTLITIWESNILNNDFITFISEVTNAISTSGNNRN